MDSQSISATSAVGAQTQATTRTPASPAETPVDAKKDAKPITPPPPPPEPRIVVPQRDPRSLQYQVDSTTHQVLATIVDDNNKTVIQQIPDAELLRIAQSIGRVQGFLLESKA